ncbi:MAG: tRNA 2-thiouridine(34) synthase MnmA [FCB group bacterium]|jgi:tRNA-specific 2-thiouridylase
MSKNKVLVGLSGGVDSSVVAALLLEQGYDVIGATITPFKIDVSCKTNDNVRHCCSYTGMGDAKSVCDILGIQHKLVDLTDLFQTEVVDNFVANYLKGFTPNPCVICNPRIKWGELLKMAEEADAHYIATGHYARINFYEESQRYVLSKGENIVKDQSYFLWKLSQEQLSRTLFPLGEIPTKDETRAIAKKYNLPVFDKVESQEVCFIPDDDYHNFIKKNVEGIEEKYNKGDIIFNDDIIGKHNGYPFYTIGQRKGLGISYKEPLYVKKIYPETNTIEVGTEDMLYNKGLIAGKINYIKSSNLDENKNYTVKIRYRDKGSEAKCRITDDGFLKVDFMEPKKSITPGQSVVVYDNNDLVCGGFIEDWY